METKAKEIIKEIRSIITDKHLYAFNSLVGKDRASQKPDRLSVYFQEREGLDDIVEDIRRVKGVKTVSHICTNDGSYGYKLYIQIENPEDNNKRDINLSLLKVTEYSKDNINLTEDEKVRVNKDVFVVPVYCVLELDENGDIYRIGHPKLTGLLGKNLSEL